MEVYFSAAIQAPRGFVDRICRAGPISWFLSGTWMATLFLGCGFTQHGRNISALVCVPGHRMGERMYNKNLGPGYHGVLW